MDLRIRITFFFLKLRINMPVVIYLEVYNTTPYSGDRMDFIVKGNFKAGEKWERFKKKVTSGNKNSALEKVYSLIGSEHGLKRNLIKIESIEEAKP